MTADAHRGLSARGSRPIAVGALARVERAGGDVWTGRVSYVNGEVVGLKASTIVDGRITAGDSVTLVFGQGESMVAAQARVLAASGSFLRLSRRESSEGLERRRALRVPVEQAVEVACAALRTAAGEVAMRSLPADLTDMSASGCALRTSVVLPVGHVVEVSLRMLGTDVTLSGKVVRTWRGDESRCEHAGIQFEPVPASTASLVNRYLIAQLRETSNPRAGCDRRSPVGASARP